MALFGFTFPHWAVSPPDETDGHYAYNEDHGAEAINNLIYFFKEGPRNQALLQILGDQIQELETVASDLRTAFDIGSAVGDQLDILGEVLNETRKARDDDDYRAALRAMLLVYKSSGTLPQMLEIAQAMVPDATFTVRELYPNTLEIATDTLGGTSVWTIFNVLRRAKAAGVRLLFGYGGPIGAVDGDPAGGTIGAVDGDPAGFSIGAGT